MNKKAYLSPELKISIIDVQDSILLGLSETEAEPEQPAHERPYAEFGESRPFEYKW